MSETASGSPRNARLEAVSRFISAAGLAILLLSAATVIAARLLITAFPEMLDGRDVIESGLHPNYLRNIFELISFVSGLLLVITAIFAGAFTISQIKEAERLERNNLGNAPEQYFCFRKLVDRFKAQFKSV
jgi:hypothetical protein